MQKKSKSGGTKLPRDASPAPEAERDRVTYREMWNPPGRVWERLAENRILTLVAEGKARAIVIPVDDGNAQDALEAYRRGRAMMAISSLRRAARERGASGMSLAEINAIIRRTRDERR